MKSSAPSTPNVCYHCGEAGHYANHYPRKQNQLTPQGQHSNQKGTPQKPAPNTGKVNHVSSETVLAQPEVMLGTFDVNSTLATVLFDSGALHSFISQAFVRTHSIPLCAMKDPILVNSPGGSMQASYHCLPTSLSLRGRVQSEPHCVENIWY